MVPSLNDPVFWLRRNQNIKGHADSTVVPRRETKLAVKQSNSVG